VPIRVLHVIDHLGWGGAQLPIPLNFARYMNNEEFASFVCTLRPNRDVPDPEPVITLPYSKWDPRTFLALPGLCRKHRIDIVHAHLPKAVISCLLASYRYKEPLVIHEHGGGIFPEGPSLYRLLLRRLRHRAGVIIAVSEATARQLRVKARIDPQMIRIIYSAIDLSSFDASKVSKSEARAKLRIADKDIVLGFVGRLHKTKGAGLIIKALSLLLRSSPDYRLFLAGDGPERKRLELLTRSLKISDRARFLGVCSNVPEIMAAFDVGVMPSLCEPFGRVAVEFMRMKVPVVCSGLAGLAELVKDGETGIVSKENTPIEICRAVERLMQNPDLRNRIVENAYTFAGHFGIKTQVQKLKELYRCIMQKPDEADGPRYEDRKCNPGATRPSNGS
jgi:glycosyltransferase involved in cell wall biosynthesis